MEIAVGAVINDRFVVLGRIGAGAVAVVYLVRHLQLGSLHAIKVLMVPTPFVQQRLLQEGRLQSTLRDPHVVAVTDVVDVEGAPGLVMDFVRGPSLERLLQHVHFDPQQAVALGTGILSGMRTAHQAGMIHRDLKPANVLIDVTELHGQPHGLLPKIADFGLAKILHGDEHGSMAATRTGSTLGTPAYMSPEQIRDARSVDERADVWALGAVLYELLTGHRAFPGDDLLDLFDRIRDGRYRAVRSLAPEVPGWLERVVDDALQVDRDRRIASVAELHDRWTQGRGDDAADIEWSPTLLSLVASLAPEAASGMTGSPSAPSGATFALEAPSPEGPGPPQGRPSEAATVLNAIVPEAVGAAGELAVEPTLAESASSLDLPISSGIERPDPFAPGRSDSGTEGTSESAALCEQGQQASSLAEIPALAGPALRARPKLLGAVLALSAVLALLLMCMGSVGMVVVGLTVGWLQPGPKVPVHVADPVHRPVYAPRELPRVSDDPGVEAHHQAAWLAIRQGRLEDALTELKLVTEAEGYEEIGLRLLIATAEIGLGDASGYRLLERTAESAVARRGPLADLARIAGDALRSGPEPARVKRHLTLWPDDELARLLLPRLPGWEGERRLDLIQGAVERDPHSAGPVLLLIDYWLDHGSLMEAGALLDQAEQDFPEDPHVATARARWLLLSGRPSEARRLVESLARPDAPAPLEIHAAALRELGDLAALDAIEARLPQEALPARVAFAHGRAEAAFGLGKVEEALEWLSRGFEMARLAGRFDDTAKLARLHYQIAVLLGRPEDLPPAVARASSAAALLDMPRGLHDRLTSRILLLEGLIALSQQDYVRVQANIESLEGAERGERLAAVLRSAALATQRSPTSPEDLPGGCVSRLISARWQAMARTSELDSVFTALAGEESPCTRTGVDRYVRGEAEVLLALSAVQERDYAAAEEHLMAVRAWVPEPDLGSPLHNQLSDVEEALAWRE